MLSLVAHKDFSLLFDDKGDNINWTLAIKIPHRLPINSKYLYCFRTLKLSIILSVWMYGTVCCVGLTTLLKL